MSVVLFLAFLCFLVSAIWCAVTRSYTLALIAAGLALWILAGDDTFSVHIGR